MQNQINVGDQNNLQVEQNPVNQPVAVEEKPKTNYWMILSVILFVLLIVVFGLYVAGLKKGNENQTAITTSQPSPTHVKEIPAEVSPSPTEVKQTYQLKYGNEIENTLKNIFNNTITFDKKKDNVSYFQKEFDFSTNNQEKWQHINIIAYLYKEGDSKFKEAYEGSEWTIDLDDVAKTLLGLKEGTQISKIYDATIAYEKAEVTFSKFGKRNWAIYDTYFKPGGNWDRHYVTYDQTSRKIVFVTFSFVYYKDFETHKTDFTYNQEGNYFTQVKYPEEISSILKELETILSLN